MRLQDWWMARWEDTSSPTRSRATRPITLVQKLSFFSAKWLCLLAGVLAFSAMAADAPVALTPSETAWLHKHPVVTLALDDANAPLNYRRADAQSASYSGASLDYMQLIARKTGMQLRFEGSSWAEALRRAMAHEVDGVMSARDRKERRSRLNFSEAYLELPIAMATRANWQEARVLSDFGGHRIAVGRDTVRIPVIRERCPSCTVIEVGSPEEGMDLVVHEQADGFFDDLPVVQRAIEAAGSEKFKVALLYYYSEAATIRVALRNDAPELLSIFNKGIAAIRPDEHQLIRARWLTAASSARIQRDLPLSETQRSWLIAHPTIRVSAHPSRAPLESLDKDGQYQGISIEFLHRVEEMLGVRFEFVPTAAQTDPVQRVHAREVDLVLALATTPHRRETLNFTEPYLNTPMAIFGTASAAPLSGLEGLQGQRVAVMKNSAASEFLDRDWPALATIRVNDAREAIRLLRSGSVQAYLGALLTTTHHLVEAGDADIRVIGETGQEYRVSMAVRNDWPEFATILDKALSTISRADRESFRQKWSAIHFAHKTDYRPLIVLLVAVLLATGFIVQLRYMVRRRTAELMVSNARERALVDQAPEAILVFDVDRRRLVDANRKAENLFGAPRKQLLGTDVRTLVSRTRAEDQSHEPFSEHIERALAQGTAAFEHTLRLDNGEREIICDVWLAVLPSPNQRLLRLSFIDVTARKQAEARLRHQALHDDLTGLPNRRKYQLQVDSALARGMPFTLLLLNPDRLRLITESLGYGYGDQVLQTLAQRLRDALGSSATAELFRFESALFAVLLAGEPDKAHALAVADHLRAAAAVPMSIDQRELTVTVSVGMSTFPDDGRDTTTLTRNAEAVIGKLKKAGGNAVAHYTQEMNTSALEALELESDLRQALRRGELLLHYQPQVDLTSGQVTGAEALLRWQHPTRGLVSPLRFIPIAERNGLIVPIGEWVVQTASRQARIWQDKLGRPFVVAVNVSAHQFESADLPAQVRRALDDAGLAPEHLELEVTESVAMIEVERTVAILQELAAIGVRLALDDFGTGYSSLSYLKRYPIHKLKIDQSFVRSMTLGTNDQAIVASVINLGRGLGLRTIAEGVESEAELRLLQRMGCEEMQGYLFSRPLPSEQVTKLLSEGRTLAMPADDALQ